MRTIHGWHEDHKSLTACGLGWIYGRAFLGKKPLAMTDTFTEKPTCKNCLRSKNLKQW
jgi:hypothetical protein